MLVNYAHATNDGRLVFGRGGSRLAFAARIGNRFAIPALSAAEMTQQLYRMMPTLPAVHISHAWAGPVDRSHDGVPLLGYLDRRRRVYYAAGLSGNGIGPSLLLAKMVSRTMMRCDDEFQSLGNLFDSRRRPSFPYEPLRFIGGRIVRASVLKKESLEEKGVRVPAVLRYAARHVPR
jgi:glycine/D-amino acid oxidase-like deaminating enzyme